MKIGEIHLPTKTFYHGTTSDHLPDIRQNGFSPRSYFTISLDDATYYAATGGEWDLQRREEEYEQRIGTNPREHFYPDMWDMYRELYPQGQHPVVIEVSLPVNIIAKGRPDTGAEGGLVFDFEVSPDYITAVVDIEW